MVRMPEGMRDRIAEAAKLNSRSMNSEIVARLEASLNGVAGGAIESMGESFADILMKATQTPQFAAAILQLREEALRIAPELADVDYADGKPVKKK